MRLPSSHSSRPARTKPSPQVAATQVSRQASVFTRLPSSQASTPARTKPSPHAARHTAVQAGVGVRALPSSHCSTPACTNPSPQVGELAGVHDSRRSLTCCRRRTPPRRPARCRRRSGPLVQCVRQASVLRALPSSHGSTPARTKPSPQVAADAGVEAGVGVHARCRRRTPRRRVRTKPSPQRARCARRRGTRRVFEALPSSHCLDAGLHDAVAARRARRSCSGSASAGRRVAVVALPRRRPG